MKGPAPVDVPTAMRIPKIRSTKTKGISQRILNRQRKTRSSFAIPSFTVKELNI